MKMVQTTMHKQIHHASSTMQLYTCRIQSVDSKIYIHVLLQDWYHIMISVLTVTLLSLSYVCGSEEGRMKKEINVTKLLGDVEQLQSMQYASS